MTEVYCHGCEKRVDQDAFCPGCEEYICADCRKHEVEGMHFPEDHYTVTDERQGELL